MKFFILFFNYKYIKITKTCLFGFNLDVAVWGVTADVSASYMQATNADEKAISNVFKQYNGEVIIAKGRCITNIVSISNYVRPVFTDNFISGLVRLNKTLSNTDQLKQEYVKFIQEFGTHYMKQTSMGSELIYERIFTSTSNNKDESKDRSECTKQEAEASLGVSGWGQAMQAAYGYSSSGCKSGKDDSRFESSESSEIKKIISRGSRPTDLDNWITSDFIPVPIDRVLQDIEDLFRNEWLSKSDDYGFHESLDGDALRETFYKYKNDYCGLFLGPFLNHNCSVNGNIMTTKVKNLI